MTNKINTLMDLVNGVLIQEKNPVLDSRLLTETDLLNGVLLDFPSKDNFDRNYDGSD